MPNGSSGAKCDDPVVSEPGISFGDRVRIASDPAAIDAGFAGRLGVIYGYTTPSVTSVDVIGDSDVDLAYNVGFEEDGVDAWFAPGLVELVDHSPGLEITIGDKRLVRDETSEWREPPKRRLGWRRK
jgi:hypothetical protein